MDARTNDDLVTICSVTEMAAKLGLSRSRFYQLMKARAVPQPVRCERTNRPFYPPDLQQRCIEIRKTRIGLNGQPVLFYAKRHEGTSWRRPDRQCQKLTDALRGMGLTVTVRQVKKVTGALYPEGIEKQPNLDVILGGLFRHLSGGRQNGV